jgi:hypothetical protein
VGLSTKVGNIIGIVNCSDFYMFAGNTRLFEWPNGAIRPEWNDNGVGNIFGCGILLDSKNEFSMFFTGNGTFMGWFSGGTEEMIIISEGFNLPQFNLKYFLK